MAPSVESTNASPRGSGGDMVEKTNDVDVAKEAYFVPVEKGMTSYCPSDLHWAAGMAVSTGSGDGIGERGSGSGCADDGRRGLREEKTEEEEEEKVLRAFELLGVIIGANLMWNKVLNLNLNPVVWKTVLLRKMHLSDLELVDGMYYRSMRCVLDMEGVKQLGLTFDCLELNFCANSGGVDPGDDVTDENKSHALSQGLKRLVPLRLLKMFTESELGLLLAGPGEIDPDDWQRHTGFFGEASTSFQQWLWLVVRGLTNEERSLLLQFATGCSRLPAGGFSELSRPFTVSMLEYDPKRPLPMAATCFNMLKLPRYTEKYLLRKFILVGIRHGLAGFAFS